MERRSLLRAVGAIGAAGLAGCFGDPAPTAGSTPTPTPTPTPEPRAIEETDFQAIRVSQSGKSSADVTFDAPEVHFTGTIEGANGCKTAALESASYDDADDVIHLRVETVDREGTTDHACTQALVYVDYEATIRFSGGVPSRATVSHDGREVLSGGHDSAGAGSED